MGIDLLKKLKEARSENRQEQLLNTMLTQSLSQDEVLEDIIRTRERSSATSNELQNDKDNVFRLNEIKQICVDYRLRFLDVKYFKGKIPMKGLVRMRRLEEEHGQVFKSFKIIAPAELFQLEEKDKDPMLFGQFANGEFYFIHKWGKDMSSFRKMLVYPFKNAATFIKTIFVVAAVIAFSFPESLMVGTPEGAHFATRMVFFFYVLFATTAWSILYAYPRLKNFNTYLWNSRYFD